MPIVGIAPIMVMWFGFDWQSKAAVVVRDDLLPDAGQHARRAGRGRRHAARPDALLRARATGRRCCKLRLPAALPFVFNALKINSTLALIGAIVAEFFGSPIARPGLSHHRPRSARLNVDMVWAAIAVAALAGSVFYGVIALSSGR